MHDPKIIEAMARAMCKARGTGQCAALCLSHSSNFTRGGACPEAPRLHDTAAALTALCTLHPGVAALLSGEAVAVPRENLRRLARTAEMSARIMRDTRRTGKWEGAERVARQFDRMGDAAKEMLASPWAQEEKRDAE